MSVAEALITFFEAAELDFQPATTDGTVYRVPFAGSAGSWEVFAQVREDQDQILFYSMCPVRPTTERVGPVMELLTRINYGLVLGNFEIDLDDGEIRYKTASIGASPTPHYLHDVLMANVALMDTYLPAIEAVIAGRMSPADAVEILEAADYEGEFDDEDEEGDWDEDDDSDEADA